MRIEPSDAPHELSLILLAYDEEKNLAQAAESCLNYLREVPGQHELILVDDGSTDGTPAVVQALIQAHPEIRALRHETNRGMGAGMRTGILAAQKPFYEAMASDGQVDPSETNKLLSALRDADFVISKYTRRDDGLTRTILSRGLRLAMRLFLGGCVPLEGLYVFPTTVAKEIIREGGATSDSFLFSFELLQRGVERGLRYATTYIDCKPRAIGRSKVAHLRIVLKILAELFRLRWARAGTRPVQPVQRP